MAPVIAIALLVTACAAPAPRPAEPPPVASTPPPDAAVVLEDESVDPPPAECRRRTWRSCLSAAHSLRDGEVRYRRDAIVLYRILCLEGDRRGCFEEQVADDVRTRCTDDGLVEACFTLGELHERGEATCPVDDACASALFEMACHGGHRSACAKAVP